MQYIDALINVAVLVALILCFALAIFAVLIIPEKDKKIQWKWVTLVILLSIVAGIFLAATWSWRVAEGLVS